MTNEFLLIAVFTLPVALALVALAMPTARLAMRLALFGALATCALDALLVVMFARLGPLSAAQDWFRVDALAAWHIGLLVCIYVLSSLFALVYFEPELTRGELSRRAARVFGGLWCGALAAMTLLLVANNLGLMWVGMEATTLLTAFLIALHTTPRSLEAMWKYVLICSVAVAFAFMGTLLAAAAAPHSATPNALNWTDLLLLAPRLDPMLMRAAFVFLLVGYGTKAGLAPMHNWLPDAHSQAPAPVSALFSGFMLNAALYCVLRYLPILGAVPGCSGWAQTLLLVLSLLSLFVGAGFILFQQDAKRLLAYCSVEHIGLVGIGVGLGGLGTCAALFHSLNHGVAKALAFFAVGRLGQAAHSHEITRVSGAMKLSPLWGAGLVGSFLALSGAVPFATFYSELQITKAVFDARAPWLLIAWLLGLAVAFTGMLRHTIRIAWARPDPEVPPLTTRRGEALLMILPLAILVALCLVMPQPLARLILEAANIVDGARPHTFLPGIWP